MDADRDTYPVSSVGAVMTMCSCGLGYTARAPSRLTTDCDDTRMDVNPGATELCDGPGVDENCNRSSNENCGCNGTESGACAEPGVCGATGMRACNGMGMWGACSVQPTTEVCTPTTFADGDCNGLDDVQQGLTVSCYDDPDGDGYSGAGVVAQPRCPQSGACPALTTARAPIPGLVDCAPTDPNITPGRAEQRCDGVDDNCNGTIDDDNVRVTAYVDGDRDGVTTAVTTRVCPSEIVAANGLFASQSPTVDCDDRNMNVFPGQTRYFGTPRFCRVSNSPIAIVCACGDPGCNYRNFDYNCDMNNDDRQSGSPCTGPVPCSSGYYTSPEPCGTPSQFQFCTAGATMCSNGILRTFNQPCR